MKLKPIATWCLDSEQPLSPCGDGVNCPAVHAPDRALAVELRRVGPTAVVQGYLVEDADALFALSLSAGEGAVEIPVSLLMAAAIEIEEQRRQ